MFLALQIATTSRGLNVHESHETEANKRLFSQIFDVFVTPEVKRRQEAGLIPKPVNLTAAQVIFYPDGRPNEVRINSEVRGQFKATTKVDLTEERIGDPVYAHEIEGLHAFQLLDDDDPDCGHITILRISDWWWISFDFIYNKGISANHIEAANQFLENAEHSLNRGHWSAFVDCLFSAAELSAKAVLLGTPDPRLRESKSHGMIHDRINQWAHLGNVAQSQVDVFNRLSQLRASARYSPGSLSIERRRAEEWLQAVRELRDRANQQLQRE